MSTNGIGSSALFYNGTAPSGSSGANIDRPDVAFAAGPRAVLATLYCELLRSGDIAVRHSSTSVADVAYNSAPVTYTSASRGR